MFLEMLAFSMSEEDWAQVQIFPCARKGQKSEDHCEIVLISLRAAIINTHVIVINLTQSRVTHTHTTIVNLPQPGVTREEELHRSD